MPGEKPSVHDNPTEKRYEVQRDGLTAFVEYRREGERIIFTHTEVPPPLEGHGLASLLAAAALEDARSQGLTVIPLCPFVSAYIRRHREFLHIVEPAYRRRLER